MRRTFVAVAGGIAVALAVATAVVVLADVADEPGAGPRMGMHQRRSDVAASTEVGYLTEMVAHHEEAVVAARELERSERPQLRTLGGSIVASQTAQIDLMERWLERWYPDRPAVPEYRPMMRDLSGLSGDRLDRAFLQHMIPHHMTAVMRSQHLLVDGGAEHHQVAQLAVSIRDEQRAEISWMQRRLSEWFDVGWRHHGGPRTMW